MPTPSPGTTVFPSPSADAQRESKHKHLEFTQIVIVRMAANSFLIKGWSVTIIAALTALSSKETSQEARIGFLIIAASVAIVFWGLDGYYLWQERLFRAIYENARNTPDHEIDFELAPNKFIGGKNTWLNSLFSATPMVFHSAILGVIVIFSLSTLLMNTENYLSPQSTPRSKQSRTDSKPGQSPNSLRNQR